MRHLEDAADHFVMGIGPIPALAQPPAIDDVTDQIERLAFDRTEKVDQHFGVAAAGAEMNV